ncbi:TraR/DksA family transcriptional regulator [Pantoea agglomerans]|uniref:TraR/DksA family transcriptional regulator n=1 Tax=Enterobacter agglomerans TaxID=549 RepID=UPI0013C73B73|nr:TraR/DksA family transcriptional regulator [Pantoea agglomerans]NEG82908.1 TraR/DksA family transcriptional regulator [Pantoea agglomerans]WNK55062.1 TraR/DksA family transcriptional regulator [Pantoea agglomerans]
MADSMDIVQQRTDEMLARNIANIVNRAPAISASFCEDCDAPISEKRRRAYLGVTRCLFCQEIEEQRNKHRQGNS